MTTYTTEYIKKVQDLELSIDINTADGNYEHALKLQRQLDSYRQGNIKENGEYTDSFHKEWEAHIKVHEGNYKSKENAGETL